MIPIKYFNKDITPIIKTDKGDWIDLRAAEEVALKKGEYKAIPLGIGMKLPRGYEAIIAPRSSTFKRYHIICPNSIGIIDNAYQGDNDQWHFLVYALEDTVIPFDERICQFRIQENQYLGGVYICNEMFDIVEKLGETDRGGIGSTNKEE